MVGSCHNKEVNVMSSKGKLHIHIHACPMHTYTHAMPPVLAPTPALPCCRSAAVGGAWVVASTVISCACQTPSAPQHFQTSACWTPNSSCSYTQVPLMPTTIPALSSVPFLTPFFLTPFYLTPTGPNDPPLQRLQYQTLSAGEIEALLAGQRGVVMLQLWVGWDTTAGQPLYNCLVLHGLRRALGRKDISIFMSNAPGEAWLGVGGQGERLEGADMVCRFA